MVKFSEAEQALPIPGYQSNGYQFNAQKFSRSVDTRVALHLEKIVNSTDDPNILWDGYAKDSIDAGRLLVPTRVFEEMRYIALAHGFGAAPDDLPRHNSLWDEVIDSTLDDVIKEHDGDEAGYVMSVSAYDISRSALIRILVKDQIIGNWYRDTDWRINHSERADET